MLTPLGKLLRKLRIDRNEKLYDLAKALKVTSAYLSAIELGRKAPTDEIVSGIASHYALTGESKRELVAAADRSAREVRVNLERQSDEARDLAVAFARRFNSLTTDEVDKLLGLLSDKGVKKK